MKSPLALHEALLQAQVPPIAAEKAAAALESDMSTVLATKQDLQTFGDNIRRDIADLRTEMVGLMTAGHESLRHEFKTDHHTLRAEFKAELLALRHDMTRADEQLRHDMVRENQQLRHEMQQGFATLHNDMTRLGNSLLIRLSGVMVAVVGLAATAQHLLQRAG
ncbi:MAG: hypothetical protein RL026_1429 [Pseudomonadota bacterium]|jgi:hypothetical protein